MLDLLAAAPCALVTGEPGGGKSTCLRRLLLKTSQEYAPGGEVRVLAPLFTYRGDLDDVLFRSTRSLTLEDLHFLARGNRLTLLLDALNECPESFQPACVAQIGRWRTQYPAARLVVTTRSLHDRGQLRLPTFMIQPLPRECRISFLAGHLREPDLAAKTVSGILAQPGGEQITENPLLLRLVAQILNDGRSVPKGRASLYRGFISGWYQREARKAREPRSLSWSQDQVLAALAHLAFHTRRADQTVCSMADAAARLNGIVENPDMLLRRFERGLLYAIVDEQIVFLHETFQEYLASEHLIAHPDDLTGVGPSDYTRWGMVIAYAVELADFLSTGMADAAEAMNPWLGALLGAKPSQPDETGGWMQFLRGSEVPRELLHVFWKRYGYDRNDPALRHVVSTVGEYGRRWAALENALLRQAWHPAQAALWGRKLLRGEGDSPWLTDPGVRASLGLTHMERQSLWVKKADIGQAHALILTGLCTAADFVSRKDKWIENASSADVAMLVQSGICTVDEFFPRRDELIAKADPVGAGALVQAGIYTIQDFSPRKLRWVDQATPEVADALIRSGICTADDFASRKTEWIAAASPAEACHLVQSGICTAADFSPRKNRLIATSRPQAAAMLIRADIFTMDDFAARKAEWIATASIGQTRNLIRDGLCTPEDFVSRKVYLLSKVAKSGQIPSLIRSGLFSFRDLAAHKERLASLARPKSALAMIKAGLCTPDDFSSRKAELIALAHANPIHRGTLVQAGILDADDFDPHRGDGAQDNGTDAMTKTQTTLVLDLSIQELTISIRAARCLKKLEIKTVKDLIFKSETELLESPNFGRTSLNEIKNVLAQFGLRLDMRPEDLDVYFRDLEEPVVEQPEQPRTQTDGPRNLSAVTSSVLNVAVEKPRLQETSKTVNTEVAMNTSSRKNHDTSEAVPPKHEVSPPMTPASPEAAERLPHLWRRVIVPLINLATGEQKVLGKPSSLLPRDSHLLVYRPTSAEAAWLKAADKAVRICQAASESDLPAAVSTFVAAFDHPAPEWDELRLLAGDYLHTVVSSPLITAACGSAGGGNAHPVSAGVPASCADGWVRLVPRLVQAARSGRPHPGLPEVARDLTSKGWDPGPLAQWIPNTTEATALAEANDFLGRIMNPSTRLDYRDATWKHILEELNKIPTHQTALRSLAEARVRSRLGAVPGTIAGPRKTSGSAGGASRGTRPARHGIRRPRVTPLSSAIKGTRVVIANPRASDFKITTSTATIYIDEVEVGRSHGAIGGIVWDGPQPDFNVLKSIPTHSKNPIHIPELLGCSRAFPFVIPVSGEQPATAVGYEDLIRVTIQIVLGWLLPPPAAPVSVRIFLEHIGAYHDDHHATGYFQGMFQEVTAQLPSRFSRWNLESVVWKSKEFGYIPWGDLLAYWYLEQAVRGRPFGSVDVRSLPGFVPVQAGLLERVKRLDTLESTGAVADALDLTAELDRTRLGTVLQADLVRRVKDRPDLKERLLEDLDARYQAKERDLRRLRPMLALARAVVGDPGPHHALRLRLLWAALALHDANHDGDPLRVAPALTAYETLREHGMNTDRELVAHLDANMAVHLADRFEFAAAQEAIERCTGDRHFEALSLRARGRALSSLGQYCAMQGQHDEAEEHFAKALVYFREDHGLSENRKRQEQDQTTVYRAINAMDGALADAMGILESVIGNPVAAAERLAPSTLTPFHHHLLLRTIWQRDDLASAGTLYLAAKPLWVRVPQHPWMLTDLYRALLLWDAKAPDAEELFASALAGIQDNPHGATLDLVGGMIATVAWCCLDGAEWKESAESFLRAAAPSLPGAAAAVTVLREILANPSADRIDEALSALPFTYH